MFLNLQNVSVVKRRKRRASVVATLATFAFCVLAGFFLQPALGATRPPANDPAAYKEITIFPPQLTLTAGRDSHHLLVNGLADFEVDVTGRVQFTSDHPAIATVDTNGIVRALSPGTARLTAKFGPHSVTATARVDPAPEHEQLSFQRDILPILSKAGCNAGGCHAKPEGQNGFKLSVFAYDPQSDYDQIVKHNRGRRVFPAFPEESLLLKKALLEVDHGGGQRFDRDSEFHLTLLKWIREGMPFAAPDEPELVEIQVYPKERRYGKEAGQRLLVRARYSDGDLRDVTGLAEFESTEKEFAQVDEDGRVSVGTLSGEGVIIARFMGHVDVSRVTVPADRMLPASVYAQLPVHNFIDEHVYARLQRLGLAPSELCSDGEFIRRASLDVAGVLPSPEEVRAFLADQSADKRNRLIDRLLQHPGYADHWAVKWGDLIRPNPSRVGVKSVYLVDLWLRESFQQNKPYDRFVRELVTAQGNTHQDGPAVVFRDRRLPEDLGEWTSHIFLGVRLECAKCHQHPTEKWSQADFYQFAAYFSQVKRKGKGISAPISGDSELIYYAPGGEVKHPVTGNVLPPKPLAGPAPEIAPNVDPRQTLADWMAQSDNPYFARATVNRIWGEFFGRGIVEPVDDFRASNPPSNESLLEALARDFVAHGYDLKHLMRTLMQSRTYQLSSAPTDYNLADTRNFARSYRRRLPAEVLLDAVCDLTEAPENFQGMMPGGRAVQTWNNKLPSDFLIAFGRPDSSAECPCERDRRTSVVQALHLMNSSNLQNKLTHKDGRAARLAASSLSNEEIVTELYLAAYSRLPDADEAAICLKLLAETEKRQTAIEDILWALINSAEFVFNH